MVEVLLNDKKRIVMQITSAEGKTIAQACNELGITPAKFYYYKKRIGEENLKQVKPKQQIITMPIVKPPEKEKYEKFSPDHTALISAANGKLCLVIGDPDDILKFLQKFLVGGNS